MKRGLGRWETIYLVSKHLERTQRRCFTYKGLRKTWSYYRGIRYVRSDWHTIERAVRKLAEEGVLKRVIYKGNGGKTVIFCKTSLYEQLIRQKVIE